jgi:Xaa-Pro dipeptidase
VSALVEVGTVAARVERLRDAMAQEGLDAFVATADESIAYLTGFRPLQLERLFAVVVRSDGGGGILVPKLDLGQIETAPESLQRVAYDASSNGLPELEGLLDDAGRIGVEEDHIVLARSTALSASGRELVQSGATLMDLRARKDAEEVEAVRRACALVERAYALTWEMLRPGTSERELNGSVEAFLRSEGASATHPLILFGENAANPHADPTERALRVGDVVCADISACVDGYWGDLTRCATVGPASGWAQETWALVRDAQQAAISKCVPGVPAGAVEAAERVILETRPDLGEVLHGAGHAVGLALHEPPYLVPTSATPLAPGMIFTVEPGLYRPDAGGIRLEDDVVVRDGAPELLSTLPLDLVELPV